MKQYDAIIIGFGKGGKTLASELAAHNRKVAMIERSDQMYGGTCPNIACIPTKTLIHQAKMFRQNDPRTFMEQAEDYKLAINRKNDLTHLLREKNYRKLAEDPNITVYTGEASFLSADTVQVTTPYETLTLQSPEIFINTGSEPVMPPIRGLDKSQNVYTSTTLMQLKELPRRLLIIGGGYIGLEFASMYAEFDSKVTILDQNDRFLPREDKDIADYVKETLEKKGISILTNVHIESVYDTAGGTTVTYVDQKDGLPYFTEGDALLVATGRKAYTKNLNLEAAGIQTDARGNILVDEQLRTTSPNIHALGDVKGGLQFTYISLDDYRIVRDHLFGEQKRTTADRTPVPYSVFIDPPLSHIGMNEEEARQKGIGIKVATLPASTIPRAHTLGENDGILKAIVDAKTGKILGCTLFCAESHEVINLVSMAMKIGQDYTFLRDFIFTHPAMSEALNSLFAKIE